MAWKFHKIPSSLGFFSFSHFSQKFLNGSGLSIKLSCDLWGAKLQEAYFPTENGWVLKILLGIIEVIKLLNHSRTDKCHPLLLQSSVLSTLYTVFNQLDLKFLVNSFLMGHVTPIISDFLFQRSALNFKYVLLKIMDDIYGISP